MLEIANEVLNPFDESKWGDELRKWRRLGRFKTRAWKYAMLRVPL